MKLLITLLLLLSLSAVCAQDFIPYSLEIPGVGKDLMMIPVEGKAYLMGSPDMEPGRSEDEGPQHEVTIGGFWMADMEITWEQYEAFVYRESSTIRLADADKLEQLGIDGISSATMPYAEMSFGMGKEGYPAVNMTQYAALMYCKWLSAISGEFYRLPTEAEWELACKSAYEGIAIDTPQELTEYVVFDAEKYEKVGSKKPTPSGFYDLLGNVTEWTMDQYDPGYYASSESNDPWLVPTKLYPRTTRGGSWKETSSKMRCSARMPSSSRWKFRDPQLPKSRWWHTNAPFVGFRIVRPLNQPSKKQIEQFWLEAMEDYGQ